MNFNLNLNKIINVLECTNIELAEASKLDSTIISKFKNSIRIPTIGSKSFNSLINGICIIATEKNKIESINDLCGINENLYNSIYNYFINNSNNIRLSRDDALIGTNLEKLMKAFKISNVMIAKYFNKDSSLISKYKNGKRYILKNDNMVFDLCDYFENYIIKNNLQDDASLLLSISSTDDLKNAIFNYLFTPQKDDSQINSLLEKINDYESEMPKNIPSLDVLNLKKIITDKKNYYIGIKEFRDAIKRFLSNVCLNKNPTTLYLYSDENMKWLLHNKDFYKTWKNLMINCLIKRNNIKIIHNINRNPDEMLKAIESWFPLYMTGLIEPYYNVKNNNNFTHTLFIADRLSIISASSISCNNDCNIYNYSENEKVIESYKIQFIELIKKSKPLIKIHIGNNINHKLANKEKYYEYMYKKLKNIIIMIKKDDSEVLVLKNNSQKILFEFTYPKMIDAFKKYVNIK